MNSATHWSTQSENILVDVARSIYKSIYRDSEYLPILVKPNIKLIYKTTILFTGSYHLYSVYNDIATVNKGSTALAHF